MQVYVVSDGDTPAKIASHFGIDLPRLINLNPHKAWLWVDGLPTFTDLQVGEGLQVPGNFGLGQLSPDAVVSQAGGSALATVQNSQQVQAIQQQGQQLYTTANQIAAQGTGVANGNLQSIIVTANLTANNIPPSQVKQALQGTLAVVSGTVATGSALTAATAWLVSSGFILGGSAAAAAIPVFGTAVVAMVLAMQFILSQWGASSPTTPTPGVVQALLNVPLPTPQTMAQQGTPTQSANEPALFNPSTTVPAGCESSNGGGTAAGALAAWRDFLDMAANPNNPQPTTQRGNTAYPPFTQQGNGFALGCASWQACADAQLKCVGNAMGGQPNAAKAIALAVRWVPLGDPWVAPYQDTFSSMGAGANETGWYLENQLVALAYTFANWPQDAADQQALAYLTTLAWVWNNYPGAPSGPIPGWISYKLGHLQALVSQDKYIQPPSATNVSTAATSSTKGNVVAAVAGATAFAVTANAIIMGVGLVQSFKYIANGIKNWGEKHL